MLSVAFLLLVSVVDLWQFGTDPDPDPQIHTTELPVPALFVSDFQDVKK